MVTRYAIKIFILFLILCVVAFLTGLVVIDFAFKTKQFFSKASTSTLDFILNYYKIRLPLYLYYILPSCILFSALFTFVRLAKNNELVPIVVAGADLRFFSLPFLFFGIAGGVVTAGVEELVLPNVASEISQTEAIASSSSAQAWNVLANDSSGNFLRAVGYNRAAYELTKVRINLMDKDRYLKEYIVAERAKWNGNTWEFYNVTVDYYEKNWPKVEVVNGVLILLQRKFPIYIVADIDVKPKDLEKRQILSEQFMSFGETLEKTKKYPEEPLFSVFLCSKFASPLAPLILVMGGLPFVVRIGARNFFIGIGLCVSMIFFYYFVTIVFSFLGGREIFSPVMATLLPALILIGLALTSYYHMRT